MVHLRRGGEPGRAGADARVRGVDGARGFAGRSVGDVQGVHLEQGPALCGYNTVWLNELLTAWIAGGANRFLSLKAPVSQSLYLTQPLPFEVPSGQLVSFRVDVRPPTVWGKDGGNLNLYLGGDEMCQFANAHSNPLRESIMMFGLHNASISLGRYTNSLFRVQNGDTISGVTGVFVKTNNWYRMVGSTLSGSDSWKLRVYDMGTAHPEIDAPAGPLVTACDGLARRGTTSGISALAISAGGVTGLDPWDLYDRGRVLVDNIVVSVIPAGACIIVR